MFTKLPRKEENYTWCFFFSFLKETVFFFFLSFPTLLFPPQSHSQYKNNMGYYWKIPWSQFFRGIINGQGFPAHLCGGVAANTIRWQQSRVKLVLVSCETHMVSFSLHCPLINVFFLSNVKLPSLLWNHDSHSATKKKKHHLLSSLFDIIRLSIHLSSSFIPLIRNHSHLNP